MKSSNEIFKDIPTYPFEFSIMKAFDRYSVSNKKKEKWKTSSNILCVQFLILMMTMVALVQPVSSYVAWDGVVVTASNFQALEAFKNELSDPYGFLRSWNDSGYGACSGGWEGIKCAQGQVIVLQLPWRGLGGRISEKIGQLQGLRKLSLHDNQIGGSIPSTLGLLPNLRGVQLFNNKLSGSIPASLGFCPLLQTLDLSHNSLSGSIPDSFGNSSKLFRLNLGYNSLSGSIPDSLTRLDSLMYLSLLRNNLSGSIPDSWGGAGKNISYKLHSLALDYNAFAGNIPSTLGELGELRELSISHNRIGGVIPVEIGKLSKLKSLNFSYNSIKGTLPASLSNLSSLEVLDIESNNIDSLIPDSFDRLHNLSVLDLKRNQLTGEIPVTIGNISSLRRLDLSQNNLSGEIPPSLDSLSSLNFLNVSYNNLSGEVPTELAQKFSSSSFLGNIELCGYKGSPQCPSEPPFQSAPAPFPETPKSRHHRKMSTKDIILIAAGALLIVLFITCCILLFFLLRKRTALKEKNGETSVAAAGAAARAEKGAPSAAAEIESGGDAGGKLVHFDGPIVFTADDLLCATAEIMGKSTYGTVYKATLEDRSQVAVKRLREKITKSQKEFEAEVNFLGRIRHPNLLALRAYYLGPKGEKLIVFDYMPKGSLATYFHARGPDTRIDWPTRMKIIQGMTRGLSHLHTNENIIHGNLTSSNVLLDEHTDAKIADFGLSRLMTSAASTNVLATAGALGYRAPELSKLKKANTKTDVYSLGVIILELLTGKSPSEATNGVDLPQWVASVVKEEWTTEVFDVELMRDASSIGGELLNTLKLALHCVDPSPAARPEVQQVLQQLEEIRPELPISSGDDGANVPPASD